MIVGVSVMLGVPVTGGAPVIAGVAVSVPVGVGVNSSPAPGVTVTVAVTVAVTVVAAVPVIELVTVLVSDGPVNGVPTGVGVKALRAAGCPVPPFPPSRSVRTCGTRPNPIGHTIESPATAGHAMMPPGAWNDHTMLPSARESA